MIPEDRKYTADHEWAQHAPDGTAVRIGITDFAQDKLGDIVFVTLPAVGDTVEAGAYFGEVESTKSVSDLYAPVAGTVTAVNPDLEGTPEVVNSDPFGAGWMVEIEPADPAAYDQLLDSAAYTALTEGS